MLPFHTLSFGVGRPPPSRFVLLLAATLVRGVCCLVVAASEPTNRATRWSPTSSSTTCSRCALALTSDQEVLESICGGFGGAPSPRDAPLRTVTMGFLYSLGRALRFASSFFCPPFFFFFFPFLSRFRSHTISPGLSGALQRGPHMIPCNNPGYRRVHQPP